MKIKGCYGVLGYAVTVKIYYQFGNDNETINEKRVITFCLDEKRALTEYNNLTTDDILNEYEKDNVVDIGVCLEEWEFSDSPNDFGIIERMYKSLEF